MEEKSGIAILPFFCGVAVFAGALYDFAKEKNGKEPRKMCAIALSPGAVLAVGMVIKTLFWGI